ncbi:hypothetical protein CEXT_531891 [Caerostris extrusa]|uniref:Uncharacterized protein n=1 Tax=Caerostris extrusa TaxID=172846 RepID=A0AAV4T3Q7_CAEEX|nr:hypothetical protein CEXT_531891 [Caerostris extrusa]
MFQRPLGTAKLDRAEAYLVKIQEQEFTSEIRNLQRKRCVQPSRPLWMICRIMNKLLAEASTDSFFNHQTFRVLIFFLRLATRKSCKLSRPIGYQEQDDHGHRLICPTLDTSSRIYGYHSCFRYLLYFRWP